MHSEFDRPTTPSLTVWWSVQAKRANYGEFVQALLRVGIGVVLLASYYGWSDWSEQVWVSYFCWSFVILSFVLLGWIYRSQQSSDVVRFMTLAVDMGTPTVLLGLTGERSVILVFVYTWVAVGHGFRFGLRYLHVAWITSLFAFGLVYLLSAQVKGFWYQHPMLWVGAFIWIAAPTLYVAQLLKQKLVAVQAAEEARIQAERARGEAERERVERARAEAERARTEAEAASEAKSEFLATMSHEMRTPLNGVVGAAEMLAERPLGEQERKLTAWLLTSSRQLRALIDNLLDLRKIESGMFAIEREPFDLHALLNRLTALMEPEARRPRMRFITGVSLDVPYLLQGDEQRLLQVLINLVGNALKFTQEGFVRVSVCAVTSTAEQVTLRFEVRDTGIGISAEDRPRVFNRFSQANPTIYRQFGGSGLGTTICKHLIELMGGDIGFDSERGKGSLFWFTVPLALQSDVSYENAVSGATTRGATLLVASDDPMTQGWVYSVLGERGWKCRPVSGLEGAGALDSADDAFTTVVLVDGENTSMDWHSLPSLLGKSERQATPWILLHSKVEETEAYDLGYRLVLKSRQPQLLVRAMRTLLAGPSPSVAMAGNQEATDHVSGQALRILVAEDNAISQQLIQMILERGGHHVKVVSDGEAALDAYHHDRLDLLILDMNMPGANGLEVAKTVRMMETHGKTLRTPIIMLTAAASTDLQEASEDAGIDRFLAKPIDPRGLLAAVREASGQSVIVRDSGSWGRRAEESRDCIDWEQLDEMARFSGDPTFLERLALKFGNDADGLLAQMTVAISEANYSAFKDIAHALKGAAMMAGAMHVREISVRAEQLSDKQMRGHAEALLEEMRRTLEETQRNLRDMIASRDGNLAKGPAVSAANRRLHQLHGVTK